MIEQRKTISVLSYNENYVIVDVGNGKQYTFNPSEMGAATVIPMTLDEIKYANNSQCFKSGLLEFCPDDEEEIYNILEINDWKSILKLNEIKDIILHPTYEGLKKLINVKSSANFERVRGVLQKLQNADEDITVKVIRLIEQRYDELLRNQTTTSIVIKQKSSVSSIETEQMKKLQEQNELLKKQIEEMKAAISQKPSEDTFNEALQEEEIDSTKKSTCRAKKS